MHNGTFEKMSGEIEIDRYRHVQAFRYNQRELTGGERFRTVCDNLVGKRLTYRGLIGQADGGEALRNPETRETEKAPSLSDSSEPSRKFSRFRNLN